MLECGMFLKISGKISAAATKHESEKIILYIDTFWALYKE